MEVLKQNWDRIRERGESWPILKKIEEKTGVKSTYIFYGVLAFITIFIFSGYLSEILADIVGLVYPAFMSLKALNFQDKEHPEKDKIKPWLIYWSIFGIFIVADTYLGFVLSFLPMFYILKFAFVIYLTYPNARGAVQLYDYFIKDLFLEHHEKIDSFVEMIIGKSKEYFNKAKNEIGKPENIAKVISTANDIKENITKRSLD